MGDKCNLLQKIAAILGFYGTPGSRVNPLGVALSLRNTVSTGFYPPESASWKEETTTTIYQALSTFQVPCWAPDTHYRCNPHVLLVGVISGEMDIKSMQFLPRVSLIPDLKECKGHSRVWSLWLPLECAPEIREREAGSHGAFYDLISEITHRPFCHFLFIRSKSLSTTHTQRVED